MPLPLTVSCFSKIQIGFTFLVPTNPGSPGKGPLNGWVCVCVCCRPATTWQHPTPASLYQLHPLHLQADRMQHGWTVGVGTGQGCRVKTCGRVADLQSCGLTRQTERAFCQWYSAEFPIYINPIYNKLLASEPHDRHCPEATVNGIHYGKIRSQSEHVSRLAGSTGLKLLHHVL